MTERYDTGADNGPDDLTAEQIASAARGESPMSYEDIVVAGATALEQLSSFSNAETTIGRCTCSEGCTNVRLVVFRHPMDSDVEEYVEPYPVADGRGPDLWSAAVDAHVQLTVAIAKANERQEEIDYLNSLLED